MARRALVAIVLPTLVGCVVAQVTPGMARIPGPVGRVDVMIAPDLAEDRLERYRDLEGDRVIREAIERELMRVGVWRPGGDVGVQVTVTAFRLRSATNVFFSGWYAGDDELFGLIEIHPAAAAPQPIAFRFSSNDEVFFNFSSGARFRRLVNALAHAIHTRVDAS